MSMKWQTFPYCAPASNMMTRSLDNLPFSAVSAFPSVFIFCSTLQHCIEIKIRKNHHKRKIKNFAIKMEKPVERMKCNEKNVQW